MIICEECGEDFRDCYKNNQTFRHPCQEWDGMIITKDDPEIQVCLCFNKYVSWLPNFCYKCGEEAIRRSGWCLGCERRI